MQKLPADFLQILGKMGELMSHVEALNLGVYETKTEANRIFVKI